MPPVTESPPDPNSAARLPFSILVGATIAFLSLPVALFLLGWMRFPLAVLSTGALLGSAWIAGRRLIGSEPILGWRSPRSWTRLAVGSGLLVLVLSVCGVAGFGAQSWDWAKHEAVLADLVEQHWPIAYRLSGNTPDGRVDSSAQDVTLVYYVAFYLPAALVGRVCGWRAAHAALFLWTALGLVLSWQWVVRLARASPWTGLGLAILFAPFDLPGALLFSASNSAVAGPWWQQLRPEFLHGAFTFPGNLTQLLYAPNQALGGWLSSALVLEALRRGTRHFPLVLPIALCLLWSPFAALGLLALVALYRLAPVSLGLLRGRLQRLSTIVRGQVSGASLLVLAGVALPLVLYFAARLPAPDLPASLSPPTEARVAAALRFLPETLGPRVFAMQWIRYAGAELLLVGGSLAVLLWLADPRPAAARLRRPAGAQLGRRFDTRLLAAAVVLLGGLPLLAYGFYNDWAMRASIPALFALQVLAARALSRRAGPAFARRAFLVVLLGLAAYPMVQLREQVVEATARGRWIQLPARAWVKDLFAQQQGRVRFYGFVEQYLGRADALFFRRLARTTVPRPIDAELYPPQGASGSRGAMRSRFGATGSAAKSRAGYRASRCGIESKVRNQRAAHISTRGISTPSIGSRKTRGYSRWPRSAPNS